VRPKETKFGELLASLVFGHEKNPRYFSFSNKIFQSHFQNIEKHTHSGPNSNLGQTTQYPVSSSVQTNSVSEFRFS
jgi:hypothetical protein